jgi:hypothetical protein
VLTAIVVMMAVTAFPLVALWYQNRKDRLRFEATLTAAERERLRGFRLLQPWREFVPADQYEHTHEEVNQIRWPSEASPAEVDLPTGGDDSALVRQEGFRARSFEPRSFKPRSVEPRPVEPSSVEPISVEPKPFEPRPEPATSVPPKPPELSSGLAAVPVPEAASLAPDLPTSGTEALDPGVAVYPSDAHPADVTDQEVAGPAGEVDRLEAADTGTYSMEELRSKAAFCRWKAAAAGTELEKGGWQKLADRWQKLALPSDDDDRNEQPN